MDIAAGYGKFFKHTHNPILPHEILSTCINRYIHHYHLIFSDKTASKITLNLQKLKFIANFVAPKQSVYQYHDKTQHQYKQDSDNP
jgi:hypothetical protein